MHRHLYGFPESIRENRKRIATNVVYLILQYLFVILKHFCFKITEIFEEMCPRYYNNDYLVCSNHVIVRKG